MIIKEMQKIKETQEIPKRKMIKLKTAHNMIPKKIIINAKNIEPNKNLSKVKNEIRIATPLFKNRKFIKRKTEIKLPIFKKTPNFRKKPKILLEKNNRGNTKLFDKCKHFYGNYIPKFSCCGKFYACYMCHDENENHPYQFSNKVICLFCKNVYAGKTCTKCKVDQLFQRKYI